MRAVRRLQNILVVLTALVWLPASSHSLLEGAGIIHERHADHDADSGGSHEHDADNHEAADGKLALTSTHVSVPVPNAEGTQLLISALQLEWTSELHIKLSPSGLAPPGTAPPQLSHCWQFAFRTALPPRAPSLTS